MSGSPTTTLAGGIRALRDLSVPELRRRHEQLSGRSTRSDNRPWLIRGIVRRMTEGVKMEGRNARRAVARALESALAPRTQPDVVHDARIPPVGSMIRRRHKGESIEVRVTRRGFRFQGRHYASLSAIACAVTRSHWNGLHWFGLAPRKRSRSKA